jgi:hypothetical protein
LLNKNILKLKYLLFKIIKKINIIFSIFKSIKKKKIFFIIGIQLNKLNNIILFLFIK